MNEAFSPLAGFSGTARLFPLPDLVFFPNVMQPLHVFEPRYRQLTADALAGDRLMALVLLRPGWEKDYAGSPPIYSVATLGVIAAEQKLDDGRYNILLRGLSRIQIVEEIPHAKLYRKARAELLIEVPIESPKKEHILRARLAELVPTIFAQQPDVRTQIQQLVQGNVPLGVLSDLFAFALPLEVEFKQNLLEELDIEARTIQLLDRMTVMAKADPPQRSFPPKFSVN